MSSSASAPAAGDTRGAAVHRVCGVINMSARALVVKLDM